MLDFWQRLRALVGIPFDLHALVDGPRHHAGSGEEGVVDGVERDISVAVSERHTDDHEVVDMVQVLPNTLFGDAWVYPTYYDVSSRS